MAAWLRFKGRRFKRLSKRIKRTEPFARATFDSVVTTLAIVAVRASSPVYPGIFVHPVFVGPVHVAETTLRILQKFETDLPNVHRTVWNARTSSSYS